jgi:hypothetical protein
MLKYNITLMLVQYLVFAWILNKGLGKLNAQLSKKDGLKIIKKIVWRHLFYLRFFE